MIDVINQSIAEYAPTIVFAVGSYLIKTAYTYIKLKLEDIQKETQNKELARVLQAAQLEDHLITKAISYAEEKKRQTKKQSKENSDVKMPGPADMLEMASSFILGLSGQEAVPFSGKTKDEIEKKIEATLFGARKDGLK